MDRRRFLLPLAIGSCALPQIARGTARQQDPVIGYLTPFRTPGPVTDAFREGLREHGYVEGQNVRVEYRSTEGRDERYAALAAELVNLLPDLLVAQGGLAALALRALTRTIPIVMAGAADAVAQGIIDSLARPAAASRDSR